MSFPAAQQQQQQSQALRPRLSSLSTLPSLSTYPASLEDAESSSEAWVLFSPSSASREPADYDDAYSYSLTSDERHALQEEQEDYEEEEEEEDEETDVEDVHKADLTISSSLLEPFIQGQAASLFVAPAHDGAGIFDESISERIESWRMETARLFLSEMGCFDENQRERILQVASGKTTRQVSRAPTIHNDGGDYDGYSSTESEEDPLPWWQMVLHEILHGLDGMFHDIYQAALHIPPHSQHLLESSSDLSSLAAASEAVAEASTSTLSLPSLAASSDATRQQERQASTPTFLPTLPPQTAPPPPPAAAQEDVRFWEQSIGLNTIPSIFSILKRRFNGPMEHGLEGFGMKSRVSCASGSGWGSEVGGSSGIW